MYMSFASDGRRFFSLRSGNNARLACSETGWQPTRANPHPLRVSDMNGFMSSLTGNRTIVSTLED
jgi:hypothetical protein